MWYSNAAQTIKLWKLFGSVVFGLGVWAMHFTGMLAFMLPLPMSYHTGMTALSFLPPMVGAFFAFQILYHQTFSFWEIQLSALCLALGIGSMHYLGMEAMQMDALMVYDLGWFIFSIVVAHLFAMIAIFLIKAQHHFRSDNVQKRIFIATIMGLSVAGMHYTAMGAVDFYQYIDIGIESSQEHMSNAHYIALIVAFFVFLIVATTIFCSIVDSRLQQAESTIEESITREKDIVNNLADGLIIVDETGVIDSINFMGLKMFDYLDHQASGLNIKTLMPTFNMHSFHDHTHQEIEHSNNITIKGVKNGGKSFPIEVSLSNMSIRSDDKRLFNCVIRDISKRVELENQLRQAQKLESMGQLAAGIAHEINTPTQYVSDNTIFLKDAFSTCLSTIQQIKSITENVTKESCQNCQNDIKTVIESSDLDFISEEIPLALDQSLEGLQRISKIVKAMKSFSHSNNNEMQQVDLAEAIESTITIARGEWRYVAELQTNFDNSLPTIPCFRDEFNQVILNFVINAAHAIEEKFGSENIGNAQQGKITISTSLEPNFAVITIEDNGTGIPDGIKNRIFDPFFTTKEVGKGTGQGLNLAYSIIVELHKGVILTDTTVGEGTKFTIKLPIALSSDELEAK
ncbi:MHYT domain-containing protein [Vibrio sp. NTOU-M3]|uniref:MHYT domain-containing protein n=1 Tax=Vibrio sp. NTOU-M3 TaxID=3234954 RepID=UPI0035A9363A